MAEDNGDFKILATMRKFNVLLGTFHSFFMKGLIPGSSGEYSVRVMAINIDHVRSLKLDEQTGTSKRASKSA